MVNMEESSSMMDHTLIQNCHQYLAEDDETSDEPLVDAAIVN